VFQPVRILSNDVRNTRFEPLGRYSYAPIVDFSEGNVLGRHLG